MQHQPQQTQFKTRLTNSCPAFPKTKVDAEAAMGSTTVTRTAVGSCPTLLNPQGLNINLCISEQSAHAPHRLTLTNTYTSQICNGSGSKTRPTRLGLGHFERFAGAQHAKTAMREVHDFLPVKHALELRELDPAGDRQVCKSMCHI